MDDVFHLQKFAPQLAARVNHGNPSREKPRASMSDKASASPRASIMVVDVVGAQPSGQASGTVGRIRRQSAWRARKLALFCVTVITGIPVREAKTRMSSSSLVSPGVRKGDHRVLAGKHAQIAMTGFGGMDKKGR